METANAGICGTVLRTCHFLSENVNCSNCFTVNSGNPANILTRHAAKRRGAAASLRRQSPAQRPQRPRARMACGCKGGRQKRQRRAHPPRPPQSGDAVRRRRQRGQPAWRGGWPPALAQMQPRPNPCRQPPVAGHREREASRSADPCQVARQALTPGNPVMAQYHAGQAARQAGDGGAWIRHPFGVGEQPEHGGAAQCAWCPVRLARTHVRRTRPDRTRPDRTRLDRTRPGDKPCIHV